MNHLIPEKIVLQDGTEILWKDLNKIVIKKSLYLQDRNNPDATIAVLRLNTLQRLVNAQGGNNND